MQETKAYNIKKQIDSVHTAIELCTHIQTLLTHTDTETIHMSEIDYHVQHLLSLLYTIDAVHTAYNNTYFSQSKLYEIYLYFIYELSDTYEATLTLFRQKTKETAKILHWQQVFTHTIFKTPTATAVTHSSQQLEYEELCM